MSTIPELVAAHHSGMKVIGLSLITNKVLLPGDTGVAPSHAEVLEVADRRAEQMQGLVKEIVNQLKPSLKLMNDLPKIDLSPPAQAGKDAHRQRMDNRLLSIIALGVASAALLLALKK